MRSSPHEYTAQELQASLIPDENISFSITIECYYIRIERKKSRERVETVKRKTMNSRTVCAFTESFVIVKKSIRETRTNSKEKTQ